MTVFAIPKKRTDLTAREKKCIKLIKELQSTLKKDWGVITPCKDYSPHCPSCIHYVFDGHLTSFLADLEY